MKLLLVDDEPGIREGLAALLTRKGHVVEVAADCRAARAQLAAFGAEFDLVLTDWRLPDGVAADYLEAAACPTIAMSGHPEEVLGRIDVRQVLTKPVSPRRLLETLEQFACDRQGDAPGTAATATVAAAKALPRDVAALVGRARAALGDAGPIELVDDSTFVTLRAPLPVTDLGGVVGESAIAQELEDLGGDLRVLTPDGVPTVELRWCRDGRPDLAMPVVRPGDVWPEVPVFAVDFDDCPDDPQGAGAGPGAGSWPMAFERCLDRLGAARARGQDVHFLNVPESLLSWTSDQGRAAELPMRTAVGPRLPAVLADLWS